LLGFLAASSLGAQAINRHQSVPACWYTGQVPWAQIPTLPGNDRFVDFSTWDAATGQIAFAAVCGGNVPTSPYYRLHAVDLAVSLATACSLANNNNMFIASLAPFQINGTTVFVSLREQLPAGHSWQCIPASAPAGIHAWLQQNPGYQPYSVDSSVVNGVRQYYVMAMSGPGVRPASVVFGQPLASLPTPSHGCGSAIISLDMDSPTSFNAVIEAGTSSRRTDFIAALPSASAYRWNTIHGQMERVFAFAHTQVGSVTYEYALVVNNAWSLYDIYDYPATVGYRGCPGSAGTPYLNVTSSTPGVAQPGVTLRFDNAPEPLGAQSFVLLGFDRLNPIDLTALGANACWVIPDRDAVFPATSRGSYSQTSLTVPSITCLRGLRFYVQSLVIDAAANPLGLATSNAWMITVE